MVKELDPQAVKKMLAGNADAFHQVLDFHMETVSRYVQRMTYNRADTEDIVQETFLRLWSTRHRYDPAKAKLTTWIHKIAHNLCVDSLRVSKPELRIIEEPATNGPDSDYDQRSQSQIVAQALSQLPERQRSAVVMCHYQGLSNREAAEIIDVSIDALESLLSRGRKQLKKTLEVQISHPTKWEPLSTERIK